MCPFCGETVEVDLLHYADGDALTDWHPCCQDALDEVHAHGWESLTAAPLVDTVNVSTGAAARAVEQDGEAFVALWPLRIEAPGAGVKGWQAQVFAAVDKHHRHHDAPAGWKFGVAVYNGRKLVGVAVVGRPVSRVLQAAEPHTLEVTRVCTWGRAMQRRNASSKLYGACAKRARKLGATALITYTLDTENGSSLRASGFTAEATTAGGGWGRAARPRTTSAPTCPKTRWRRSLAR